VILQEAAMAKWVGTLNIIPKQQSGFPDNLATLRAPYREPS